jgi:tripartite-type tricarboxylate transporter receptor subunit TctC
MRFPKIMSACLVACGLMSSVAVADTYPARPITLVVPFSAGGAVDANARTLAVKLGERLKESVIVENRAGAGGAVGMSSVARARPDGYTVLYTPNSIAIAPALFRKLPFDVERDLVPVVQTLETNFVIVAAKKARLNSLQDLIMTAKASPGKLNFGSSGVADPLQLGMEMLKSRAGIDMVAVPYKGQAPMFHALLAGDLDVCIASFQMSLPSIMAGTAVPLALTGSRRSALLPGVPTVAESGYPGFEIAGWHGMFVPAGTPQAIIDRLQAEMAAVLRMPDVRQGIEAIGNEIVGGTAAEFHARMNREVALYKGIVKEAKIPFQD